MLDCIFIWNISIFYILQEHSKADINTLFYRNLEFLEVNLGWFLVLNILFVHSIPNRVVFSFTFQVNASGKYLSLSEA